jgi:Ca2+-binding RTX toxin-like protein
MVSYGSATGAVTADLSTGSVTANGYGGTDTLYDIERYYGSNYGDTVTAGSTTTSITLGTGDDTVHMGSNLTSSVTVSGGSGTDTLHLTDNSGATDDLTNVSGFEHIIFDNTTTSANETAVDGLFQYGQTLDVDASTIDSSHSLTFDASGVSQGYLYIQGGAGADTLKATTAWDTGKGSTLIGNAGNDTLVGNAGEDKLFGGAGADTLTGGSHGDMFIYQTQSEGGDTITDFSNGPDKLAFYKTAAGGDFGFNSTAAAQSHVYTNLADYDTGAGSGETGPSWYMDGSNHLMFDADGHGAGAAVTIATLTGVSSISPTDIVIVDATHTQV